TGCPLLGRRLIGRHCDKRQAKHGGEDAAENQICHDFFLPAEVANFGRADQKKTPADVTPCRIAHFGLILPFAARPPWAVSEGCPRLRLDRDRQRSTKGW